MENETKKIIEESEWQGQKFQIIWHGRDFIPPPDKVKQVSGICYTGMGKIVVVSQDGVLWELPGGHPEPGEDLNEAFIREVKEEACASVDLVEYLGSQEVRPGKDSVYYQVCYASHVILDKFDPQHEMLQRRLVNPTDLSNTLQWKTNRILDEILSTAQKLMDGKVQEENYNCENVFKK